MKKSFVSAIVMCMLVMSGSVSADITDGLIGYWPLDEGTGTTTLDMSPAEYGFDGTFVGGPVWTDGQFGKALSFDGADDYVLCAERDGTGPGTYPEELMPETFTVSCWTKLDNFAYFSSFVGNGMDTGGDECGFFLYNWGWVGANEQDFGLAIRTETAMSYIETPNIYQTNTWYHLAATYDGANVNVYVDGALVVGPENVGGPIRWISSASGNYPERFAIGVWLDPGYDLWIDGIIDDVGYWDRPLTADEISTIYAMGEPLALPPDPALAKDPVPLDEATDVARDVVLGWTPGEFAAVVNGHKVYLSNSFSDVNDGVGGVTLSAASYDPGRLEFDTTYYWRVDEISAPPDSTVYPGRVWSFTVEPVGYPIDGAVVTATASSAGGADFGPENTINGSGLNDNDGHSTDPLDMWLSGVEPQGAWIQYEFDRVRKLHQMWVWNSNQTVESLFGLGFRDVTVEYSTDGTAWTVLPDVPEFAQAPAPATEDYQHNTTVDFGGAEAKYVKLTANANWGGMLPQFSLSEVRFFGIPVSAREPSPDSGAADVDVDVALGWRAGREAASHDVYVSADANALDLAGSVAEPGFDAASLGLLLGQTYHWRVDEVNDAELPTTWQGDLWSFTIQEYRVVDDFESYNDIPAGEEGSNLVYVTWADGYKNPTTNGSTIGYTEMYQPSMETSIVYGDSKQSVPLFYNNTVAGYSEVSVNTDALAIGRGWTKGSPTTMTLRFYGDPNNAATEQLYVKIGDTKVAYPGDAVELTRPRWSEWPIDLTGMDLSNVPTLAVGFERTGAIGGAGIVYLDEIHLDRSAPEIVAANPVVNGDFEYWSDHPDAGNWAYVTTIQDDPGVAWYVHDTDDGGSGPWLHDSYPGYEHIVGTNGGSAVVMSSGDTGSTVSQDLG
ncbi:MAG: discoidin domain-containing protein, partial [Phycisphaerales bacterium]